MIIENQKLHLPSWTASFSLSKFLIKLRSYSVHEIVHLETWEESTLTKFDDLNLSL